MENIFRVLTRIPSFLALVQQVEEKLWLSHNWRNTKIGLMNYFSHCISQLKSVKRPIYQMYFVWWIFIFLFLSFIPQRSIVLFCHSVFFPREIVQFFFCIHLARSWYCCWPLCTESHGKLWSFSTKQDKRENSLKKNETKHTFCAWFQDLLSLSIFEL